MPVYEWLKAFHIITVISWMAGLLYLPRLFVYHCECERGSVQSETFKMMEQRLLKVIMTPAMIASWGFGLAIVLTGGASVYAGSAWFLLKLAGVVALTGMHFYLAQLVRGFAEDANSHSSRFFRIVNEVPTVLMIAIVILVVVKPF